MTAELGRTCLLRTNLDSVLQIGTVKHPASVKGCIKGVVAIHPCLAQVFRKCLRFGVVSAWCTFRGWRQKSIVSGCCSVQNTHGLRNVLQFHIFQHRIHKTGEDWVSRVGALWAATACLILLRQRHRCDPCEENATVKKAFFYLFILVFLKMDKLTRNYIQLVTFMLLYFGDYFMGIN